MLFVDHIIKGVIWYFSNLYLYQGTTKGKGYLPKDRWYDFYNHSAIDSPGHYIMFDLPMEKMNIQIRGGSIFPLQSPDVTTTLS